MTARPPLSIIVPVVNEAAEIVSALEALGPLRARGAEVVVVDGGSADRTVALATPLAEAKISFFAVSTFDTDYLLVASETLSGVIAALEGAGHTVYRSKAE